MAKKVRAPGATADPPQGPDVEHAAARRELAGGLDGRHAHVAAQGQVLELDR